MVISNRAEKTAPALVSTMLEKIFDQKYKTKKR